MECVGGSAPPSSPPAGSAAASLVLQAAATASLVGLAVRAVCPSAPAPAAAAKPKDPSQPTQQPSKRVRAVRAPASFLLFPQSDRPSDSLPAGVPGPDVAFVYVQDTERFRSPAVSNQYGVAFARHDTEEQPLPPHTVTIASPTSSNVYAPAWRDPEAGVAALWGKDQWSLVDTRCLDQNYFSTQTAVGCLLRRHTAAQGDAYEYLYVVNSRVMAEPGEMVKVEETPSHWVLAQSEGTDGGKLRLNVRGSARSVCADRSQVVDAAAEANVSALSMFVSAEVRRFCSKLPEPYNRPDTFPVVVAVTFALDATPTPDIFRNVVPDYSLGVAGRQLRDFFAGFGGRLGVVDASHQVPCSSHRGNGVSKSAGDDTDRPAFCLGSSVCDDCFVIYNANSFAQVSDAEVLASTSWVSRGSDAEPAVACLLRPAGGP